MNKTVALQILALLENARIAEQYQPASNPHTAEFALRLASAHVAAYLGYASRADWTAEASAAGLVDYGPAVYTERETALGNIEAIIKNSPVPAGR